MKKRFCLRQLVLYGGFLWAAILLSCFTAYAQTGSAAGDDKDIFPPVPAPRKALVIVAGNYANITTYPRLPSAQKDGDTFSERLRYLGFSVTTSFNDGAATVWEKIRNYINSLTEGNLAVVYFSGHGFQWQGLSYFVPVDTPSQLTTDSLTWEVVPIWGVIDNISKKKVGLGFIILDACRDNTANVQTPDGISKSVEKGLGKAVMLQSEMLIAYAANYGQISLGSMNPNENSLYTGHLVRNIDSEGRNIIEILQDVHAAVQVDCRQRNCNQYPIFEAAGGTFYPRSSDYTKKVARESWLNVYKEPDAARVQLFLCRWPVSEYSAYARRWLVDNAGTVPSSRTFLIENRQFLFWQASGYRLIKGENLAPIIAAPADSSKGQPAIVAVDGMKVFSAANATADQIATLPIGETVWILNQNYNEEISAKGTSIWSKISLKIGSDSQTVVGYVKDAVRIDNYVPYEYKYIIKLKPTNGADLVDGKIFVIATDGKDLPQPISLTDALASQSSGPLSQSVLSHSRIMVTLHDYIEGSPSAQAALQYAFLRESQIRNALISSGAKKENIFIQEPEVFLMGDKGKPGHDEVCIFLVK